MEKTYNKAERRMESGNKAHKEGRQAYVDGFRLSNNPYDKTAKYGSPERQRFVDWGNGWHYQLFTGDGNG